jgi:FtsZ-binding cell division protein ZapB
MNPRSPEEVEIEKLKEMNELLFETVEVLQSEAYKLHKEIKRLKTKAGEE